MPEHREGTPDSLRDLESFLWHDFEAGPGDWATWVRRRMRDVPDAAVKGAFGRAMQIHAALRSLQAANSGFAPGAEAPRHEALNRLVVRHGVRPRLGEDGALRLVSDRVADPAARLLLAALEAMQSNAWHRFKLCREPTCRASYYDASKAAAKTWCSMETCGSRNKMRRYRARA